MAIQFANNATTTLFSSVTASDTQIVVSPGEGALFPAAGASNYFMVTLVDIATGLLEIMKVTNHSGDVFTVVRAQEGTAARAFTAGSPVELRLTTQSILDAVDEGLIERDPTRKAIIKGKPPVAKKIKYLNQFELHTLLISLDLKDKVNWDYFILLVAQTGMRFSEALALTPKDFDFAHQTLSISKTWDYKGKGGFQPTKNKSSVRKIQIDWQTVIQFSELVKHLPEDKPIFVNSTVYNSTVNDILGRHCKACNIPVISIHGLRHTHASLLLFTGVSIASVARRLGHSSMTTTQKTYLHIIQELENKDIDLVMRSLSGLS